MINNIVGKFKGSNPFFYFSGEKIFLHIFCRRNIVAKPPMRLRLKKEKASLIKIVKNSFFPSSVLRIQN